MTQALPTMQNVVMPLIRASVAVWRVGCGVEMRWSREFGLFIGRQFEHKVAVAFIGPLVLNVAWLRWYSAVRPNVMELALRLSWWRSFAQLNLRLFRWRLPHVKPIHLTPNSNHVRYYLGPVDLEVFSLQ